MRQTKTKTNRQIKQKYNRKDNGQFNNYHFTEKLDRYKKC